MRVAGMCHEAWTGGHHSLKVKMQQCQPPIPVSQVQYPLQVCARCARFKAPGLAPALSCLFASQPEATKSKRKR